MGLLAGRWGHQAGIGNIHHLTTLDKYIWLFWQIHFVMWTNTFGYFIKYILLFQQLHLAILTNTFSNVDKYVFKFGQIQYKMPARGRRHQAGIGNIHHLSTQEWKWPIWQSWTHCPIGWYSQWQEGNWQKPPVAFLAVAKSVSWKSYIIDDSVLHL